jgi:hypothetical protein
MQAKSEISKEYTHNEKSGAQRISQKVISDTTQYGKEKEGQ